MKSYRLVRAMSVVGISIRLLLGMALVPSYAFLASTGLRRWVRLLGGLAFELKHALTHP